ncbi:MAG: hypothetical protein Q9Q13_04500 [Acidobacteriota bacterium]|nr:hypothetical protein [Acidobacteriota bacterium]
MSRLLTPATRRLEAVACPRCGGSPDPEGGAGFLARCPDCGVLGRIEDAAGAGRLVALPAVDADFAARAVEEALGQEDLSGPFRLHDSELIFAPFWRIRSLLAGHLSGLRRRSRRVLERTILENGNTAYQWTEVDDGREKVTREIQRDHLAVISACPLEEFGVPTLDGRRQGSGGLGAGLPLEQLGVVQVFHPDVRRQGTVLDPLLRRDEAEAEAGRLLERVREGLCAGLEEAFSETSVLAREVGLLFYPLHLIRFQVGRRRGSAAVDAIRGRVVGLRLPASGDRLHDRRLVLIASLAAGCLSAATARLALLPPQALADADATGFRLRLLGAALAAASLSVVSLRRWIHRRGERRR